MDKFGEHWSAHEEKIKANWLEKVKDKDLVMVPGDISWAMTLEEAMEDLKWIDALPGRKVLIRGNHDYWWKSITKLNATFKTITFLQNDYLLWEDTLICGSKGYLSPHGNGFTDQDEKLYLREGHRLKLSLEKAQKVGYNRLIIMMHYPPTNDLKEPSLFTSIIEEFKADMVVYGHLHGTGSFNSSYQGDVKGIMYQLVSADYLGFDLYTVLEEDSLNC